MSFKIEIAKPDDADAIAKVFIASGTTDFMRLQLGSVNPTTLHDDMTRRLAENILKANQVFVLARDEESGEIISYAQWELPNATQEDPEPNAEVSARASEEYRKNLPSGMNESLVLEFRDKVQTMRRGVLKGRRSYMLGNLGTLPFYRRRGAASALTRWPFEQADKDQTLVYLDTDAAGNARPMYERLGFNRIGEAVVDLSRHGGEGLHTHIAMYRLPES